MDSETGAVTPLNFIPGRFTHFTCDNIDINDSKFDGKNTFHATQMAAWQRGLEHDMMMKDLKPSSRESLQVPQVMEKIFPAGIIEGTACPKSTGNTKREWFQKTDDKGSVAKATAKDMAFFFKRQNEGDMKQGWTMFNQRLSESSPEMTSIGYMPIIQAPAHEIDTLNTVMRCRNVARKLKQHHVVITADEALFCKLMELKWTNDDYTDCLIVRLGGLHTAIKFLEVIGKHVQSSGLLEAWVEGSILGPKTAEQVLAGKSYAKGIRVHKITLQSMWRMLLPQLISFMEGKNPTLREALDKAQNSPVEDLVTLLSSEEFKGTIEAFVTVNDNPNFRFWWGYMEMVHILLLFPPAQRDGIWDLHLCVFQQMLPYFMQYNHINYARWGTIYLNEMHQLPQPVKREFEAGNFVVKRSLHHFSQVDPDHSQEWLGCIGKKGGGIVGITKTSSALSRWALSFNLRSHLAQDTKVAFGQGPDDDYICNEMANSRMKRDNADEDALLAVLQRFGLFSAILSQTLQNIANKDVVMLEIEKELLTVPQNGQSQLDVFVEERLLPSKRRRVTFRDKLKKNKYLTFASLFEVEWSDPKTGKAKTIKADRNILQRLISAYDAGRPVNLNSIMAH